MSKSLNSRSGRLVLSKLIRSSESKLLSATRSLATITTAGTGDRRWSSSLSFTSPEADFTSAEKMASAGNNPADSFTENSAPAWSQSLSFTSPDADFSSAEKLASMANNPADSSTQNKISAPAWSQTLSFASPDADFSSAEKMTSVGNNPSDSSTESSAPTWSQTLSFASPDADFSSVAIGDAQNNASIATEFKVQDILLNKTTVEASWSGMMSFASPESDFSSSHQKQAETIKVRREFVDHIQKSDEQSDGMVYSLSHADTDGDFTSPKFMNLLDTRMQQQLRNASSTKSIHDKSLSPHVIARDLEVQSKSQSDVRIPTPTTEFDIPVTDHKQHFFHHEAPLPHNLQEASMPDDPRAIVITEANVPFRIVSVNQSWEQLCGYSQNECNGLTLECIQGPETNKSAVTALMSQLMMGEEAGTVLANYDKGGRKFHNRLRVGPLKNDIGEVTHFVGVLKEVNELGEHFEGAGSKIHA
eukprot:CAMPEP_0197238622 /NCGR_PEP_ID=MMETSP1429-20130617/5137_1 /TAXON_ID=49237 /ORGANISM="Chaetoceros  sp., Strain UNC1202" /LENGTH=474 /DNA_ID=CAMNT_0042697837 /DNA_START=131 /DNA_END=1555 /DNA_ORIENTATION=-